MRSLIVLSAALVLCGLSTAAPAIPSLAGRQDDHCQVTTVYVTAPASDDHCRVTTIYVTARASDDNGIHTTGTNTKSYATVTVTIPGPIITDTTTVYVSPTSSQSGDHNSDTDLTVAPCFNEKTSTADSDVTITRTHTDFQTITVTVDDASTNNGIAATTVVHRLHEGFSVDTTTVVVAETIWMQGASTLPSSPATTIRSTSDNSAVAVIVSVPVFPMKTRLQAMRTETTSTYARSESLNVLPSSSSTVIGSPIPLSSLSSGSLVPSTVIGSPIPLSSLSSGSLVPSTEVNATSRMQATAQATVSSTTRPITLGYGYSGLSQSHMASFTAPASHSYSANSSDGYPVATPTIWNTAGISANYTGPRATPSGFTSSVPAYNQSVVLPSQTSLALGGFGSNSTFATSIKANSTILISTYSSQIASSTGTLADVNSTNSELSSSSSSTYPTRFTVIRPTKMTETGPTSSRTKRPMSTAYNTTFDSYTYSFTSSSTSESTVSSDFTLVEPTLVTLNPAVTTSCVDSSPSSSFATFISSTVEAASSVITNSSESSSTISANISIPTAASSAACGEQGIFSLNFDDLPPLPENLTDVPPVPIFSPYHHFWFSEGFVLAPPPKGPYLPSSKPLLVEFLTESDIDTTRNDNLHAPGAYGATGEIGNGPNLSWGCYSFDAVAASVGCDSLGAPCDWQFTGVTYDVVTDKYSEVITQRLSTPSCPEGTDCPLTNIVFLDSFASIQSLRINVTVAGVPKIWWMDDLKLDWADNSCEAGQCRASHR